MAPASNATPAAPPAGAVSSCPGLARKKPDRILCRWPYSPAALDRGCAKTPAFNFRVESSSRFGQSEDQKFWRWLSEEGNRENDSTLFLARARFHICGRLRERKRNLRDYSARSQVLTSVRPLLRPFSCRGPVWEFADRVQITATRSRRGVKNWLADPVSH